MGKTNHGFMDGFSGRLGNVVGYQWRGRMCVRSMPSRYRDAQTPEQMQQRALFKAVVRFAARARKVLKIGLRCASLNAQMTESNYFMRINKRCFALTAADGTATSGETTTHQAETTADLEALEVDYENLMLADGPVAPVAFGMPQMIDEMTISIDFEKNPLHRTVHSDDLVYLVAYCPELGDFDLSAPVYRRSNRLTMSLNEMWAGREVHLWGFVVDRDGRASQSQYVGGENEETEGADDSPIESLESARYNFTTLFSNGTSANVKPFKDGEDFMDRTYAKEEDFKGGASTDREAFADRASADGPPADVFRPIADT